MECSCARLSTCLTKPHKAQEGSALGKTGIQYAYLCGSSTVLIEWNTDSGVNVAFWYQHGLFKDSKWSMELNFVKCTAFKPNDFLFFSVGDSQRNL